MKVFKIIVIALLAHFAWANNSIKSNVTNLSANKVSAINTEGGIKLKPRYNQPLIFQYQRKKLI